MRAGLELRHSQQLVMTPQLQQAIRLLQLSALELEAELREALERNVMLEVAEEQSPSATEQALRDPGEAPDSGETAVETDWDATTPATDLGDWTGGAERPETPALAGGLREHLEWQLSLTSLSETDRAIALAIIDALDEDGYLAESAEALAAALRPEHEVGADEVEAVRRRLQRFDPVGVASRSLAECLDVQLRQLEAGTPGLAAARSLVRGHLEALARDEHADLRRRLGTGAEEYAAALALIRNLDPRPGARIGGATPAYIVPDVLVRWREGRWLVELNHDTLPRLRLNSDYARSISGGSHEGLRHQLAEARWLLRSLELRNGTLLKVATAIVEHQREFLSHGEERMRPLVLRDIAAATGLHESTVSRVTTQKYMHTSRGIYEFKYFFSSQLGGEDAAGARSSIAVQAMIRKLIGAENPRKPLSDSRIARELSSRGVSVARRTVAKYREAMAIPPSHERKRLDSRP